MSLTNRMCPVCESDAARHWGKKAGCQLFTCAACGSRFADVPAELEPPPGAYDGLYERTHFTVPESVEPHLEALVQSMERYRREGHWLDIGFGAGGLLRAAEAAGWQCAGTEVSTAALDYGRTRGWRVATAVEDLSAGKPLFEVVTLIELIEHLDQPRQILQAAAHVLRPGGVLYLTTPNANSLNRRLLGSHWSVVAPPDHRALFTKTGVEGALISAGLGVVEVQTTGLNPAELLSRAKRETSVANRVDTGYRLNAALSATPTRRRVKRAVNRLLSIMGIGDTLKVWARPA